jgi:hypothetical protein
MLATIDIPQALLPSPSILSLQPVRLQEAVWWM